VQALGAEGKLAVKRTGKDETDMAFVGIVVTFLGFVIAVLSLGMTQSVGVRLVMVLIGIVVSLFGIIGIINPAFQKNAPWRKQ
jgi:cytochrome c biogenesis protein CcdA